MNIDALREKYWQLLENKRIFLYIGKSRANTNPFYNEIKDSAGRLLDCGCGPGDDVRFFMDEGFDAYGIDHNTSHIMLGFDFYQDGLSRRERFCAGDVRSMPYRDKSFDVCYSGSIMPALDDAGIKKYIAETRRVLRPGGSILGRAPGKRSSGPDYFMTEEQLRACLAGFSLDIRRSEPERTAAVPAALQAAARQRPEFVFYFLARKR